MCASRSTEFAGSAISTISKLDWTPILIPIIGVILCLLLVLFGHRIDHDPKMLSRAKSFAKYTLFVALIISLLIGIIIGIIRGGSTSDNWSIVISLLAIVIFAIFVFIVLNMTTLVYGLKCFTNRRIGLIFALIQPVLIGIWYSRQT